MHKEAKERKGWGVGTGLGFPLSEPVPPTPGPRKVRLDFPAAALLLMRWLRVGSVFPQAVSYFLHKPQLSVTGIMSHSFYPPHNRCSLNAC